MAQLTSQSNPAGDNIPGTPARLGPFCKTKPRVSSAALRTPILNAIFAEPRFLLRATRNVKSLLLRFSTFMRSKPAVSDSSPYTTYNYRYLRSGPPMANPHRLVPI